MTICHPPMVQIDAKHSKKGAEIEAGKRVTFAGLDFCALEQKKVV